MNDDAPWELISDGTTGNEEVMKEIHDAEALAQQAMTRAAALRQTHCLPSAESVIPLPKARLPPVQPK